MEKANQKKLRFYLDSKKYKLISYFTFNRIFLGDLEKVLK